MSDKPKVLLVEDDQSMQEVVQLTLAPYAEVTIAGSIHAARLALQAEPCFALVILDGRVPAFDKEPLRPTDTTVSLAFHIKHHFNIPMYAFSGDDSINEALVKAGCHDTSKFTAIHAVKHALTSKA